VPNILPIGITVVILLSIAICWYLSQEITRRQQAERLLRQQTDRERLVNQIALQIRQSLKLDEVLATTVEEVQRFFQADRVLIYRINTDGTGCAIHETVLAPYPRILGQTFPAEVFPLEYHQAYSQGKIRTIANVDRSQIEPCLADFVKQFGVRAKLVVPIVQEHRQSEISTDPGVPYLWGLLIVHQCRQDRTWETWEVELMKQLATQVAIALQQSELYDRLQQLNSQLEQRVEQRTAELERVNISLKAEIVERQRTEVVLRHTNNTLQALVTASPRAIVMLDRLGLVKIWNPAAEEMFGWTEAEVLDRSNPLNLDNYTTLQNSVLQGTIYPRLEFRQRQKNGTLIDIVFSAAPWRDSVGQIGGIVAVITDVTAQKIQTEQLRLLQSVVINTNDAVVITEAEPIESGGPRILYVNEAFTAITGYQPHEVLGKTPRILQGEKTDRTELDKVRVALASWKSVTVEVINYRKDGSEFWNEFSLVPVADVRGFYTHWIAVQRDTTRRKQLDEIRLALARTRTQQLENSFFLDGIS
jgi:PAS domain S-box-containing protein